MTVHCRRFTLIELLVVVAIIAVLAGLLLPALAKAREQAKRAKARTEMKALQAAVSMYESDYGVLPMDGSERVLDTGSESGKYTALIQTLQNAAPCGNARGKRYLDISSANGPGVYNDPWRNPYKIALDLDYSGEIAADATNGPYKTVYNRVAIWSLSTNGSDELGADGDVCSWQE
jgi:prepilin-type N-terminal cleavage/methylation domain-containing protein